MYKFFLGVVAFLVAFYVAFVVFVEEQEAPITVPEVSYEEAVEEGVGEGTEETEGTEDLEEPEEVEEEVEEGTGEEPAETLSAQFNLAVPFTTQAPHANWELPYGEACEEASAYMVSEYYKGTASGKIDPAVADAALLDVVAFEEDFFGYYLDTTAAETVQIIDTYFGYMGTVVLNPTVEMIKREIAEGKPVIVPAAGRELGNPNFTGAGPLYHMLVIKGYTETSFITNDPGTRNGENYVYDIDVLMDAIGDWNDGNPAAGAKVVIFTNL